MMNQFPCEQVLPALHSVDRKPRAKGKSAPRILFWTASQNVEWKYK